ncbi:hypothetical protein EMCRGX_G020164 [Ephydatia muelleri]
MLPLQFVNFCTFAELGEVKQRYISSGTKNVAKEMRKICAGTVRNRDKTWFSELSDKARTTNVHLYWCMRNCDGDPDRLRAMIMNISKHFQGCHLSCHSESPCQQPGYHPKRKVLTMPTAIQAYENALKKILIYCCAGSPLQSSRRPPATLITRAMAPSTSSIYKAGTRGIRSSSVPPPPFSSPTSTSLRASVGFSSLTSNNPMLNLTIRGIQRSQAPAHLRPKRLTLTNTMLDRMLGLLDTGSLDTLDKLVLKAALTVRKTLPGSKVVSAFSLNGPKLTRLAKEPLFQSATLEEQQLCPILAMQAYLSHCRPCKHTSATAGHASIPQPLQAMQAYLSHCRPCKHTSATAGHASIPQPLQAMQAYLSHCRPCKHTSATAGHASIPQPLQTVQAYLSHCRPCKHTSATAGHASIPQAMQAYLRPCKHTSATAGHASIPQAMQAYLRPCKHTSGHASIPQPLQGMQACCTASLSVWMITLIQNPAIYPARPAALIRIQFIPVQHPQLADWCSNCNSTGRTPSIYHSKIRMMAQQHMPAIP